MRRIVLGVAVVVVAIAVLLVSAVAAAPDKIPDVAKEKMPALEQVDFIHWQKGFAKPPCNNNGFCEPGENPSCGDCKKGDEEPPSETTCYALTWYGKKVLKWPSTPVRYVINPISPVPEKLLLSEEEVITAIFEGAEEWDSWTGDELFKDVDVDVDIDYEAVWGVRDGENVVAWYDYPEDGVIAVARVWRSPATKTIVEFDIAFDTDWIWGNADTAPVPVMDVQNIATHELGHGVGLGDVYEKECSLVTMYGYSNYGETDKRDLEPADWTGIQTLYGPLNGS